MSKSHNFDVCRELYMNARKRGSPVVNVIDLGGCLCAETADGKILRADVSGCCKWAVKFEVAQEWNEQQNKEGEDNDRT